MEKHLKKLALADRVALTLTLGLLGHGGQRRRRRLNEESESRRCMPSPS
jgi:hypothetical protein